MNPPNFRRSCRAVLLVALIAVTMVCLTAIASHAQTFTTLASFDMVDGADPYPLVQGIDGNFYGTTDAGGTTGGGTVFQVTPAGALNTVYNFCSDCGDGPNLEVALIQATDGNFYGTTFSGGNNACSPFSGCGTIFKVTPDGVETTLYSFCSLPSCIDGSIPSAGLVEAANGNFYGTTTGGGVHGGGTVFEITPAGNLTTLHSFCVDFLCTDGQYPLAGLIQATNGKLYGTTPNGGSYHNAGDVFEITPTGKFAKLYTFTNGEMPVTELVQASNGNFYGTTSAGGHFAKGEIFEITAAGALTIIHSFCDYHCVDGTYPSALIQATNGNLYGTTELGGANRGGVAFEQPIAGPLTVLYSFCAQTACTDGMWPYGALIQATDGNLYGSTLTGGANNDGSVFRLSLGLSSFVQTRPTIAKTGASVTILGTGLTGASSVTFNGTPAAFSVLSQSEITTTVPDGATSGAVEVTIPEGTLTSNVSFQVIE